MPNRRSAAALLAILSVLSGACHKDEGPRAAAPVQTVSAETRAELDGLLSDYETVHLALAGDRLDGVAAAATSLASAARRLDARVPERLRAPLDGIASAGASLAAATALPEARRAFGDVSRYAIDLIAAEPQLGEGRRAFECTMTSGYGKWIQSGPGVANPYFGAEMLTCGSGRDWK